MAWAVSPPAAERAMPMLTPSRISVSATFIGRRTISTT
jgi:hypothetical protein